MKKLIPLFFVVLWGCQPSFIRKWDLQYEVIKQSEGPISYNVSYVTENGATKSEGPFTDTNWKSEKFENVALDFEVSLKVKIISGSGLIELRVLRDGATHKSDILESPIMEQTIDAKL